MRFAAIVILALSSSGCMWGSTREGYSEPSDMSLAEATVHFESSVGTIADGSC